MENNFQMSFFDSKMSSIKNNNRYELLLGEADPALLDKFFKYHENNPALFDLFVKFAREAQRQSRKRFSVWMIANRIRWYCQIETTGKDFKVSNDYLALYARMLILLDPSFDGLFTLKRMKKNRVMARD